MMLGCEKTRIRLDDWLDGALEAEALAEVSDHLAFCDECRDRFQRALALQDDLARLGSIADRVAVEDRASRPRTIWRLTRFAAAAAVVLMVGAGYLMTRPVRTGVAPGGREPIAAGDVRDSELIPLGDLMVRRLKSDRVRLIGADDCVAVDVRSSNPKVHIVWLYGQCLNQPASAPPAEPEMPEPRDTRRL
ncbi:MAG: hypothetical protein DCC65_04490 [Planctomycetota bacterium]|nr:MAG: hypothetical protein DCC65_04490 [Planctomycetota bacterium]